MARLNDFFKLLDFINDKYIYLINSINKWEVELLIQMNKKIIKKFIFHCISQFMVFKIFQNYFPLYQWHHITFHVKNNRSTKHFSKYNEFIII
jgi:hypothetical protein